MKHFVDIEVLRKTDEDLGCGIIKKSNCGTFEVGDLISITEKIDGSNASIDFNIEEEKINSFSRREQLRFDNTLDGFWNYIQTLKFDEFNNDVEKNYVIFGEWLRKNKIKYLPENMHKWYVYSIWNKKEEKWLLQDIVKDFCIKHNFLYVHELYVGPFISWEHCESFLNDPMYGDRQEGIVIRNLSKINNEENRFPHILKIVNEDFKESMKTRIREIDPEKEAAKENAKILMESIITKNRVEKMLLKLRDEQILPEEITPKDMSLVAKTLPKRIYEDCVKEEHEIIEACGEFGGKISSQICMNLAREIILK